MPPRRIAAAGGPTAAGVSAGGPHAGFKYPAKVEVALGLAGTFQVVNIPVEPVYGAYFPVASVTTIGTACLVRLRTWVTEAVSRLSWIVPRLLLRETSPLWTILPDVVPVPEPVNRSVPILPLRSGVVCVDPSVVVRPLKEAGMEPAGRPITSA